MHTAWKCWNGARRAAAPLPGRIGVAGLALWLALWLALAAAPARAQEPDAPPLKQDAAALAAGLPAEAATLQQDTLVSLPLVFAQAAFPPGQVSFVPQIVNGTFDQGSDVGWLWEQNGASFPLIYITTPLQQPGQIPPSATPRYMAWLGGATNIENRLSQAVQLPADYRVRLRFDYYTTSAEATCNANPLANDDKAGLYVNGVLAPPAFALCRGGATAGWAERTIDLSAFIGKKVTIQFRLTNDGDRNSNLYLDNIELCGLSSDLLPAQQCALAGWQETTAGSATGAGVSKSNGRSSAPSLAISSQGRPFLAWSDATRGNDEIYIRRWDGLLWQEMGFQSAREGGISVNGGESTAPSVATAPNQSVYVAWQDSSSGNAEIYVKWWNGTAWGEVGGGSAAGGGISANGGASTQPATAVASNGVPYVAWSDAADGDAEIYVRRFNGSFWEEIGGPTASGGGLSNNVGASIDPAIASDSDGTIYVAWSDDSAGDAEIYIRKYRDGQGWSDVGLGSSSGGGISNNVLASTAPALAVAPGNLPWLAWVDLSGNADAEIFVRRWNGSAWVEAGGGSVTGGGISNNARDSLEPTIAVDRFSRAVVAWSDLSGATSEIYLRRWNGSGWEDVGAGSASGVGISNTNTFSYEPSVGVGPDGTPYVAWTAVSSNVEIFIRRFMAE